MVSEHDDIDDAQRRMVRVTRCEAFCNGMHTSILSSAMCTVGRAEGRSLCSVIGVSAGERSDSERRDLDGAICSDCDRRLRSKW